MDKNQVIDKINKSRNSYKNRIDFMTNILIPLLKQYNGKTITKRISNKINELCGLQSYIENTKIEDYFRKELLVKIDDETYGFYLLYSNKNCFDFGWFINNNIKVDEVQQQYDKLTLFLEKIDDFVDRFNKIENDVKSLKNSLYENDIYGYYFDFDFR